MSSKPQSITDRLNTAIGKIDAALAVVERDPTLLPRVVADARQSVDVAMELIAEIRHIRDRI